CKGCALCADFCPFKVLSLDHDTLNEKGYHPAQVVRPDDCTGCAICALMCPDVAITVERGNT
ncbi:MAG: 4Fe-4S binding protein, partial [Oscillospiraceae bacterium]|nr:4Fe-4S binding protein [Oscillospiraceae bacterium]